MLPRHAANFELLSNPRKLIRCSGIANRPSRLRAAAAVIRLAFPRRLGSGAVTCQYGSYRATERIVSAGGEFAQAISKILGRRRKLRSDKVALLQPRHGLARGVAKPRSRRIEW
jgi:hypothetical protein